MSGLSPEARSIIEAARGGDDPTPDDRKRIRTSLVVRLGAGVAAAGAATSAGSGAAAAGAAKATGAGLLAGIVPKGIAVISAVGAIGVGAYVMQEPPPPEAPAVPVVATVSAQPAPVAPTVEARPDQPAPAEPEQEPATTESGGAVPAVPRVPDASPRLADEVEALREAHTALREGRAGEAMEVLDRDAAATSGLEQERAAMRVFALCRLGKSEEARRHAEAFLVRWPNSPHAARVRAACAGRGDGGLRP